MNSALRTLRPSRALHLRPCPRTFASSATRRADEVRIVEVGPRDGLQNEKTTISLETKLELIRRLARTGVKDIEAGSFVAPKWVPQMASSADVMKELLGNAPASKHHIRYNFLVPNMKGLENYMKTSQEGGKRRPDPSEHEKDSPAGTTSTQDPNEMPSRVTPLGQNGEFPASNTSAQDPNESPSQGTTATDGRTDARSGSSNSSFSTEISLFAAATETFSKTNTNCSIAESIERFKAIIAAAKEQNIRVRGYVSVALGCPYEGPDVPPQQVADLTASLLSLGVDEVSVADTTGMGTAPRTEKLLKALSAAGIQPKDIALHFHDTYGMALVNTLVGLEHGVRVFDSSVGGLGGCPYSKGATGNIATEDLVYTLHSLGMETGVDLKSMAEIGSWISGELGRKNDSRAGKALLAKL